MSSTRMLIWPMQSARQLMTTSAGVSRGGSSRAVNVSMSSVVRVFFSIISWSPFLSESASSLPCGRGERLFGLGCGFDRPLSETKCARLAVKVGVSRCEHGLHHLHVGDEVFHRGLGGLARRAQRGPRRWRHLGAIAWAAGLECSQTESNVFRANVPRTESVCNAPSLSNGRNSCVERPVAPSAKSLKFGRGNPQDTRRSRRGAGEDGRSGTCSASCCSRRVRQGLASCVHVGCAAQPSAARIADEGSERRDAASDLVALRAASASLIWPSG